MTELAQRYRMMSGLLFFDIDKIIDETPIEQRPLLYRKLIWNIQRGLRLSIKSKLGKEFAWIVCNLAIRCNIDISKDDIIPDNIIGYSDWRTHLDLEFAHTIIKDCEHTSTIDGTVIFCDSKSEETYLMTENNKTFII